MKPKDEELEYLKTELGKHKSTFVNREFAIFGANIYTPDMLSELTEYSTNVKWIIDNDETKQGSYILNKPCVSPKTFAELPGYPRVIIFSSHEEEMIRQLADLGVEDSRIVCIPYFSIFKSKDDGDYFIERKEYLNKGFYVYESLIREYGDIGFFLFPYKGVGDVYIACMHLKDYLIKHDIVLYRLLVVNKAAESVVKLFGFEDVSVIDSDDESQPLLATWELVGSDCIRLRPVIHWGWHANNRNNLYKRGDYTFVDSYRVNVFNNESLAVSRPVYDKIGDDESFYKRYELIPEKTVILAPYAGSTVFSADEYEWAELAESLCDKGYIVCTNCSAAEKEIPQTKRVFFTFSEAYGVLEKCAGVISVRSGFCDCISHIPVKLVTIYQKGLKDFDYDYLGLGPMGLKNDEIPIIYEKKGDLTNAADYFEVIK